MKTLHPLINSFDEVFDFMNRCDISDFGEADTSKEDLDQLWSEIDLSRDAWLIQDDQQQITGYANISDAVEGYQVDIYIHTSETPPGVEDALMDLCIERARQKLARLTGDIKQYLKGYASSQSIRLQHVFEQAGFSRHTYHYRMQIDLTSTLPVPEWPANFKLTSYKPEDELELYRLIQQAFDWKGHKDTPIDIWRNLVFRGGRFDPELFVLVWDADRLVGAALSYDEGGSGWIRQLAFHKDYRGQGLGSILLKHMFYVFQQRNSVNVGLGVAAVNESAVNFYERNGMYRSREFIEYRLDLHQS